MGVCGEVICICTRRENKEGGVKSRKRGKSTPKVRWNIQRTPIMAIMLNVDVNDFNDLAKLDLSATRFRPRKTT